MANIIEMPKLSDTMTVGTLIKWLKKEGDAVKTGDMLAEVETDKATMELESFFDGTLLALFVKAGSQVPLGAALCAIGSPGEKVEAPAAAPADAPASPAPAAAAAPAPTPAPTPAPAPAAAPVAAPAPEAAPAAKAASAAAPGVRVKISPLARKLAIERGISIEGLAGSGPGGRIIRADVLAAPAAGARRASAPVGTGIPVFSKGPVQEDKLVPVSNVRAIIAKRLLESKTQIPHFYLDIEVDAGPLMELRAQLNTSLEKEGVKLSVNDFVLKASAEALRRVPAVNCSWEGTAIRQHPAAHVSFAVAIEDGLITPVIRDAHVKTIFAISTEAKSLGKRARDKKLAPAEFTGGTFCVSNLGMMGIERFCAIINPPNAAILAVGATVKKPVVKDGQIAIGQRMTLTLSTDHRVVDGAVGAAYLAALKDLLEKPALLLL
jgi:pyruvate dehydrogenase E2 component (dihydrolipoamide acetyltransferase)